MKRVLTAVVLVPLVVLTTLYSPDWLFALAVALVAALAVEEFLTLGAVRGIGRPGKWFLALAMAVSASFFFGTGWVLTSLAGSILVLLTVNIFAGSIDAALGRVSVGLSGLLYCSVTLGFLLVMPRELILVLLVIIWVGDTAAYYGGRAFGRHPLAPRISPKKTVEGGIAGLIGSLVAGIAVGMWILGEPWLNLAFVSAITAIAGQLGDLAESALKRSAGVKDSSSILPGHGGILDRLDSLFFAIPVFYWFFNA